MHLNSNVRVVSSRSDDTLAVGPGSHFAMLILDKDGVVHTCNRTCEDLFSCHREDLISKNISLLLPGLLGLELISDGAINPRLQYLNRIGYLHQAVTQNGEQLTVEIFLNVVEHSGRGQISLLIRPAIG